MSLHGEYVPGNVFAKIIAGEIPAARIYEDATVLAFMDAFPQTRGHALVISKTSQARNLLEIEPEALAQVMSATQKVARAIAKALQPDGFVVKQFNGSAAGQTVFHLHMHIIPVWPHETPGQHAETPADRAQLEILAKQIAGAID